MWKDNLIPYVYKKRKTLKPHPPCEDMTEISPENSSNDNDMEQGQPHWSEGLKDSVSDYPR